MLCKLFTSVCCLVESTLLQNYLRMNHLFLVVLAGRHDLFLKQSRPILFRMNAINRKMSSLV